MMRSVEISAKTDPNMGLIVLLIRYRLGVSSIEEVEAYVQRRKPVASDVISRAKERDIAGLIYIPDCSGNSFLVALMEGLKPEISRRAGFNLAVYQRMLEVQQQFSDFALTPVFYKGLLLGMDIYGDLTTRFVSDIDILIRKEDFAPMRKILLAQGYTEAYPYPHAYEDYYLAHTREAMFTKGNGMGVPVSVELQWAPMSAVYGLPDNEAYFLHFTMQQEMAGGHFATVMPEQQILLLLIHHGIGDLWRSLRNVTDIAGFLNRHAGSVNWSMVKQRLVEWKMYRNALIGMHLANGLFEAEIPSVFPDKPDQSTLNLAMETLLAKDMLPKEKKNFRNIYRQFSYLDDGPSKVRLCMNYLKTMLYPSMTDLNRLSLPRYLFPLYFLLKPFRFIPGFASKQQGKRNLSAGK
jgi:hypothetical protein